MFKPQVMFLVVVLLQACAVAPPTDYDLVQDRAVSKLYKSITSFFLAYPLSGQVGVCEYEHFAGFFLGQGVLCRIVMLCGLGLGLCQGIRLVLCSMVCWWLV